MAGQRRVVITGMGLRTPIGNSLAEFQKGLIDGRTGVRAMPEWDDVQNLRTKVAGVCGDLDEKRIDRKHRRSMGRVGILSALAAIDAVEDAGIDPERIATGDCGVSFGSSASSTIEMEVVLSHVFGTRSLKGMQPSSYLKVMSHTCAANLAVLFGAKGPVIASCTACVSGSQGIGFAYDAIREGRATTMLGGGAEEMHYMDAGIFDMLRATSSKYNDRPTLTPRPFDAARDGMVVGEGSGCLFLEEYEHAKTRGARIHAEILAYSTNCDGDHLTNPSGDGMVSVIEQALKSAGLSPSDIGYVNAHATATKLGDNAEAKAVHRIFGNAVPISGIKGAMGHTLGACGAIETIATIQMMNGGFIVPTRNLDDPDPELPPIGHVMGEVREARFDKAMNNNFAFGGINTSLILGRV